MKPKHLFYGVVIADNYVCEFTNMFVKSKPCI